MQILCNQVSNLGKGLGEVIHHAVQRLLGTLWIVHQNTEDSNSSEPTMDIFTPNQL
jgi:hypothetical protein